MRPSGYPITPCSPLHDSHLSLVIVTSAPVSSRNTLCVFFHFFICLPLSFSLLFLHLHQHLLKNSFASAKCNFSKFLLFEFIFLKFFCSSYANCYSTCLLIIQCFSYFHFSRRFCFLLYFCWWPSKHSLCYRKWCSVRFWIPHFVTINLAQIHLTSFNV